jgi:hypothetical protein
LDVGSSGVGLLKCFENRWFQRASDGKDGVLVKEARCFLIALTTDSEDIGDGRDVGGPATGGATLFFKIEVWCFKKFLVNDGSDLNRECHKLWARSRNRKMKATHFGHVSPFSVLAAGREFFQT